MEPKPVKPLVAFAAVRDGVIALKAENERLREALEWYAAKGDEEFFIVDAEGGRIASFARFGSRARAALVCQTCDGHGLVGAPMRFGDGDVDMVADPCPDCTAARTALETTNG